MLPPRLAQTLTRQIRDTLSGTFRLEAPSATVCLRQSTIETSLACARTASPAGGE